MKLILDCVIAAYYVTFTEKYIVFFMYCIALEEVHYWIQYRKYMVEIG